MARDEVPHICTGQKSRFHVRIDTTNSCLIRRKRRTSLNQFIFIPHGSQWYACANICLRPCTIPLLLRNYDRGCLLSQIREFIWMPAFKSNVYSVCRHCNFFSVLPYDTLINGRASIYLELSDGFVFMLRRIASGLTSFFKVIHSRLEVPLR